MIAFLQIVAHINFGNSGGPVIDTATGRVVAIMTNAIPYIATDSKGKPVDVQLTSGISYAVPVETIRTFLVKNKIVIAAGKPRLVEVDRAPSARQYFATGDLLIALLAAGGNNDLDVFELAARNFRAAVELDPSDSRSAGYLRKTEAVIKLLKEKAAAASQTSTLPEQSKPQQ